uniref:Uncharacterized protein n=1 Tax=Noctiluca scintillans TaxID=2966 RepID=A0A7S1F5B6_NOCSC
MCRNHGQLDDDLETLAYNDDFSSFAVAASEKGKSCQDVPSTEVVTVSCAGTPAMTKFAGRLAGVSGARFGSVEASGACANEQTSNSVCCSQERAVKEFETFTYAAELPSTQAYAPALVREFQGQHGIQLPAHESWEESVFATQLYGDDDLCLTSTSGTLSRSAFGGTDRETSQARDQEAAVQEGALSVSRAHDLNDNAEHVVQPSARAIVTERRSSGAGDHSRKEGREDGSSTHVYVVSPSLVAVEEEPAVVTCGGHSSVETCWGHATHGEGRMSCAPTSSVNASFSKCMQHCALRVQGEVSSERTENHTRGVEHHASLAVGTDSDLSASGVPTQSSAQSAGSSAPATSACQTLEHSSPLSRPSDGEMWARTGKLYRLGTGAWTDRQAGRASLVDEPTTRTVWFRFAMRSGRRSLLNVSRSSCFSHLRAQLQLRSLS